MVITLENKSYLSNWELGCIIFNSLTYKLFTACAEIYENFGGSAAWLISILAGVVFLLILWALLKAYVRYLPDNLFSVAQNKKSSPIITVAVFAAMIYFALSLCGAAYFACSALKTIEYIKSPFWFLLIFFAIAAISALIFGEKSVFRLHSLSAVGIGIILIAISFLSLRYADIYNITPVFGKGVPSVLKGVFAALFIYSDIVAVFCLPHTKNKPSTIRTAMLSAGIAVIVNIIVILSVSLNMSYELSGEFVLPLYPLTKATNWGKLPARLDAAYQFALITSSILYISLALRLVVSGAARLSHKMRRGASLLLAVVLCLSLCGCYDSKEVDAKAYVIALGVDLNEDQTYRYTFQISNPLESGGSIGAEEKASEESSGDKEGNKTVDNVIVNTHNYYAALDKLKSLLSKEIDISHIKVIVYSFDAARSDCLAHSKMLLTERELRPSTNICIAESAEQLLLSVNPTLEESTVRYYELFFRNYDIPYAPVTELRDFVGRSSDAGFDSVVPVASKDGLFGMGIFSNGTLKEILGGEDVLIYKLLSGEMELAYIDEKTFVESMGRPQISVDLSRETPIVNIKVPIKTNNHESLPALENQAEALLFKASSVSCDILGVGRYVKKSCLTQTEWEKLDWETLLTDCQFSVVFDCKKVKNRYNLQKS